MKDKDIIDLLGLTDKSIQLDIFASMDHTDLEKEILKIIDNNYKIEKKNQEFVNTFKYGNVYNQIKEKLIQDGFIYRCPFCLDVSGQYGRSLKHYKSHNYNN